MKKRSNDAGKVMQLRGDRTQAKQYFEEAILVDKEGIYGRLAKGSLNDLEKS